MPSKPERHVQGRVLLGRAIRERRIEVGLSLAALSERTNLSPFTVNAYELGRRLPSLETLDIVASVLGVTACDLLAGVYPWDATSPPEPPPANA